MTVRCDLASLTAAIEASEGGTEFVIRDARNHGDAVTALRRGRDQAFGVRHPEEPDEPFLSFASGVAQAGDGPAFWADTKDVSAYPGIAAALATAVASGVFEVAECDGTLLARTRAATPAWAAPALPAWFPLPPEAVYEHEDPIRGVVRTAFFKCWTLLGPEELLDFYRRALEPLGFALAVERSEVTKEWFRAAVTDAVFARADETVKLETQSVVPGADASRSDRDRWEHDSPYATYTETWVRLSGLADDLDAD